jgi:cysteine sulfinate desulfinase/cysteine desulfurase-like protein
VRELSPGRESTVLIEAFAERNIAVSGGLACHAGDPSPSRVLVEMGLNPELAKGAVRFSMGRETTGKDVESVIEGLQDVLREILAWVRSRASFGFARASFGFARASFGFARVSSAGV